MEDKKKKAPKKAKRTPSPGEQIFKAKAVTTSKASRGFTTKKPPKAHLSYPL